MWFTASLEPSRLPRLPRNWHAFKQTHVNGVTIAVTRRLWTCPCSRRNAPGQGPETPAGIVRFRASPEGHGARQGPWGRPWAVPVSAGTSVVIGPDDSGADGAPRRGPLGAESQVPEQSHAVETEAAGTP